MKIQELINELSKIRDNNPEKDVVIEVFDIKESRIIQGWVFDLVIEDGQELVKIRQKKYRGWNLYTGSRSRDLEELEKSLCGANNENGEKINL